MSNERDTHFANYAEMQYVELDQLFRYMMAAELKRDYAEIGKWREAIKLNIAQHGYDLVSHAFGTEIVQWKPLEDISVNDIPDIRRWPE